MNPEKKHFQIEKIAEQIKHDVGLAENAAVTFADVSKFEKHLNCKIVIIYCSNNKAGYSFFQTCKTPNKKKKFTCFCMTTTIMGLKASLVFWGLVMSVVSITWGLMIHRNTCEFSFNVCRDPDCYKHPKNVSKCPDCQRLCRSQYCFEKHKAKLQSSEGEYSMCESGFYCAKCNCVIVQNPLNHQKHVCSKGTC